MPLTSASSTKALELNVSWRESLPENIAGHKIIKRIGQGSYGGVWLARNLVTDAWRAIKIVWRDAFADAKPYEREFEAIKRFEPISRSHEGFVHILQVGDLRNAFYYIMELGDDTAGGTPLDPAAYKPRTLGLHRAQGLPLEQCIEIGVSLAGSLHVLHEAGLLHRDIKPSNVIFVQGKPKLADIGLVTLIEEARSMVGTAGFIPPEGPISPRSDIYSLGKLLYEISTGKDRCHFPELPENVSRDDALLLELNQIFLRACHPDPEKRYPNAKAVQHELQLLQSGHSIKRLRVLEKRQKKLLAGVSISIVTAAIVFFLYSQAKAVEATRVQAQARKVGYLITKGTDAFNKGDFAAALPYFITAAENDPAHLKNYSLRVGAAIAYSAKPIRTFETPRGATFSPDGRWMAASDTENDLIRIFDTATGAVAKEIFGSSGIVAFSNERAKIAVASGPAVKVMLCDSGVVEATVDLPGDVRDLAFHPDGKTLAAVLRSGQAAILHAGNPPLMLDEEQAYSVRFSPSGDYLLTGSLIGTARVWRTATGELHSKGFNHTSFAYEGIFLNDESIVVTAGGDRQAVAWDLNSGKQVSTAMRHDDVIPGIALSPSGHLIATSSADRTVRLWNAETFRPLNYNHVLYHAERILSLAFIDDETLVVHCRVGDTYVWDIAPATPKRVPLRTRLMLPEKGLVQTDGIHLRARGNAVEGEVDGSRFTVALAAPVSMIDLHPGRSHFLASATDQSLTPYDARLFHIDGKPTGIKFPHGDGVIYAAFSADGNRVVTCSEDFTARIWDTFSGRPLVPPLRHRHQVHWAAFDPTGDWLVTASLDTTAVVWDAETGDPLTPPLYFGDHLEFVQFTPEASSIIAGNSARQYEMLLPIAKGPLESYTSVVYSPDASVLSWW